MRTDAPRLRAMDVGDLLDEAFALYRRNFALFAGIVAVLAVPETLLNILVRVGGISSGVAVGLGLVGLLITVTFSLLSAGALSQAIAARYLGRSITVGEAYASIGASILITLILASILEAIIVGIGFVLLIVPGVYLLIRLLFAPQAIVLERTGVFEAFARSGQLVRGSWWRVFGIALLIFIIVGILQAVLGYVVAAVVVFGSHSGTSFQVVSQILGGLIGILVRPFQFAALTLLYYDLRIRKEGFDLETNAGQMGFNNPQ